MYKINGFENGKGGQTYLKKNNPWSVPIDFYRLEINFPELKSKIEFEIGNPARLGMK